MNTIEWTPGFFTLVMYIVVLVPLMLLGFFFAYRKMFSAHKMTMTLVLVLNWALIAGVMIGSYQFAVLPDLPGNLSDGFALIPTIHGIVGLVAQLMATYLVLLMWTENTPLENIVIYRIKNIKTPMRVTLSLWLITVVLGFGVYGVWYGGEADASDAPAPDSTEEVTLDSTEEATEPAVDATEDASDPALDSTEESSQPATDATEDASEPAVDATEESAEPEVDTTEEADGE
ncbi:MAG: hypothetical protein AAFR81_11485 [Chloroflexota bacterium]